MLNYHGRRGLILFRKHLKSYLKDLPVTNDICGTMVVAKTVAEFEGLLDQLERAFGEYAISVLAKMKDGRHNSKNSTWLANSSPSAALAISSKS